MSDQTDNAPDHDTSIGAEPLANVDIVAVGEMTPDADSEPPADDIEVGIASIFAAMFDPGDSAGPAEAVDTGRVLETTGHLLDELNRLWARAA